MFDGSIVTCFQTIRPFHFSGGINKHRTRFKIRTCSIKITSSPQILLQTQGTDSVSESKTTRLVSAPNGSQRMDSLLDQSNTIGVIGGVSALSTLSFLEKLVKWSSKDEKESLPFIVCNDPVLNRELSSLESCTFPYTSPSKARSQLDHMLVVEKLKRKRAFLEKSGARCIVMPCHISHSWYEEIREGCSVPFLHVGDCIAMELKEANLKPVETGSNLRIGIIATDATLNAGFYQEKLQNQGFEVVLLDKATMEHTVIPSIESLNRKDTEGARNLLRIALQVLMVRAVNTIILASDDMSNLLPQDDPLLKKCVDPMDALARSTIQWARSMH
ncbi:hypothetical protein QJS10_CPA10g00402 [Acorus calamus]|uniref:Aspartate racemase n=1 Tax=Acorus calamus TaxID=4465 RepID=A0AAV9E328_ACOCL|nr:hypothetical protein QJS10_CPA10g00402 [Acorus calamus]